MLAHKPVLVAIILTVVVLLMLSPNVFAATCQPVANAIDEPMSWTIPTEREDGTTLEQNEIRHFTIHKENTTAGFTCEQNVPGTDTTAIVEIAPNNLYKLRMTTTDTGDRVSLMSAMIIKGSEPLPLKKPAAVTDFTVTKVDGLLYSFNFTPTTTFADGTLLPAEAEVKYYLFNPDWVRNIASDQIPFTYTLDTGMNEFTIETEIALSGSSENSARSLMVTVDTTDIAPPTPPQWIVAPAGMNIEYRFVPE